MVGHNRGVGAGGQGGLLTPHFLSRGAWPPTFLQCTGMAPVCSISFLLTCTTVTPYIIMLGPLAPA